MRNHTALLDHPVGFAVRDGRHFDPFTAISNVFGASKASSAATDAAQTQANAAKYSADLQNQNLQQTRQSLQPFINSGYGAQSSLSNMLGIGTPTDGGTYGSLTKPFDAQTFQQYQDPGYQFQLQQGQQALQNSQAAKDGVLSGGALKDLIGFNQGMASNAYQNAFGRYMSQNDATYGRLSNLLGVGENAAAGLGNTGAQVTSGIGNTLTSGAAAQAAGQVGSANAWTNAINNANGYYALSKITGNNGNASSQFSGSPMGSIADLFNGKFMDFGSM